MADKKVSIGSSLRKFYKASRVDKKDISAIYMFVILAGLVQLSLPLGIQSIVSFVMAGTMSTSIVVLILLVVFGTFLNGLLQVRQLEIIEKLKQKIFLRYGLEFADRLPKLNAEKLDQYYLPELVNRFFDTLSLQKGLDKLLLDLPAAVIQIFLGLLLLSFYHPIFIGFGALLLFIILVILRFTSPQGLALALESSDYKYQVAAWLQEIARSVKSFKYSKSELHISKTDKLIGHHLDARTSYFKVLLVQFWSLISFKIIITAAMLFVGATLLVEQQINVGQFIAADIVIIAIINSVEKLILSLDKVYETLVSIEKLDKITEAEKEAAGNLLLPAEQKGVSIEFADTGFIYPDGKKVLEGINLQIPAGKLVHLRGTSGSGKSTLLRLLTGTYKNFTGKILIDGQPVGSYDLQSLRDATGVLLSSQEVFQGSLWQNLTMDNPEIDLAEVTYYVEKTGLLDFLQSNPEGFNAVLDPVGKRLPKQTRQRILLVRAMLGRQRLLLLEEPFEHLDETTRNAIFDLLRSKNATVLIASDDERITEKCEVIFTLEKV